VSSVRIAWLGIAVALAGCELRPGPAEGDLGPDVIGGGGEGCPAPTRTGAATGTFTPSGGASVAFEMGEIECVRRYDRGGTGYRVRAIFGSYDPAAEDPAAAGDFLLVVEAHLNESELNGGAWIRANGAAGVHNGTVTWDADHRGGHFESYWGGLSADFACDPDDALPEERAPLPEPPPAGTAYVTDFLDYVTVVPGIVCDYYDGSLRISRDDATTCDYHELTLSPARSQALTTPATYTGYYSQISRWTLDFVARSYEIDDGPGTLELTSVAPFAGFVTFPLDDLGSTDLVEFTCP
jgi:hypothetical protein